MKTQTIKTGIFCDRCNCQIAKEDKYCKNCGRRMKKKPTADELAAAADKMCSKYCKWPDEWDEEKEKMPLCESDHCQKCPITVLLTRAMEI